MKQKIWFIGALLLALAVLLVVFREYLSPAWVAERQQELQMLRQQRPAVVILAAFCIYFLLCLVPLFSGKALVFGWLFDFWTGLLLVSFASTMAALGTFLLSRYLLRDIIRKRMGGRVEQMNDALRREGPYYLFALRMIPVPFTLVNLGMGLTPMTAWTFWWITQLGMLPGNIVFVYAGSNLPSLDKVLHDGVDSIVSTPLLIGFALLGLFPLVTRLLVTRLNLLGQDEQPYRP